MSARNVGRFQGRLAGRASRADLLALAMLSLLAMGTVVIGRRAAQILRPTSAIELGAMLDDLDAPGRLPDVELVDLQDRRTSLFDRIQKPYAVISFYAPWCGPCQKELPKLIDRLGDRADVLIVVSKDEDREHTRRQLSNLSLLEHGALIDVTGQLFHDARVTALPTTYLVDRHGSVRRRAKGFSEMDLFRMQRIVETRQR